MMISIKNTTLLSLALALSLFACSPQTSKEQPKVKATPQASPTAPAAVGPSSKVKTTLGAPVVKPTPKKEARTGSTSAIDKNAKRYYSSSLHGFKIEQPANWEVLENQVDNVPVVFINRPKGSFSNGAESISIAVEPLPNSNLDNYYILSHQLLLSSGQIDDVVEESAGKSKQGLPFKRIIYNRKSNKTAMKTMSFLYYYKDRGYVVTCSAVPSKFGQMRPYFEKLAASMSF